MEKKCLEILGFSQRPTEKELKTAYKKLIKQHHPDVTGGETSQRYIEIDTAYKYLTGKVTYREAAAILYPKAAEPTQSSYQRTTYTQAGGFTQADFENMFGQEFGGFYTYEDNPEEYDEQGYYRQKYYSYDFSWLKWVPLILLLLFILFMVIFFKFVAFLFTPAGLVLLAIYLLWRVFFKNRN